MPETVSESRDKWADELAIRAVVNRYADASSCREPDGVARTLTPDGEWHSPGMGTYEGRASVMSFFTTMLQDWNAFTQALLSGVVVLDPADPDRAKGRWFVEEVGQRTDGANLRVAGVYHDEYVRRAGSWFIGRRRYDPLLIRADDAVTALPFPADVADIESAH